MPTSLVVKIRFWKTHVKEKFALIRPCRLSRRALKMNTAKLRHPYGAGQTGERIAQILADIDLRPVPVKKRNSY